MLKPVLAAALLVAAAGAWYWALLPVAAPRAADVREPRVADTSDVPRVRLDRLTVPVAAMAGGTGRDPFRHGRVRLDEPSRRASNSPSPATPTAAASLPSAPAWPRLELIGVAEGRDGAAVVRTAILSGPRGVHHAKPGETVEQVYRLDRIAADGVELRLLPEDRPIRLVLRP
ncbi:MAG TPA: hypothetical protein VMF13_07560 [Luteitalea sp.]|nr:hypothetical protein [Luteitalea sp.]